MNTNGCWHPVNWHACHRCLKESCRAASADKCNGAAHSHSLNTLKGGYRIHFASIQKALENSDRVEDIAADYLRIVTSRPSIAKSKQRRKEAAGTTPAAPEPAGTSPAAKKEANADESSCRGTNAETWTGCSCRGRQWMQSSNSEAKAKAETEARAKARAKEDGR